MEQCELLVSESYIYPHRPLVGMAATGEYAGKSIAYCVGRVRVFRNRPFSCLFFFWFYVCRYVRLHEVGCLVVMLRRDAQAKQLRHADKMQGGTRAHPFYSVAAIDANKPEGFRLQCFGAQTWVFYSYRRALTIRCVLVPSFHRIFLRQKNPKHTCRLSQVQRRELHIITMALTVLGT